jgi:hypothetical protein
LQRLTPQPQSVRFSHQTQLRIRLNSAIASVADPVAATATAGVAVVVIVGSATRRGLPWTIRRMASARFGW